MDRTGKGREIRKIERKGKEGEDGKEEEDRKGNGGLVVGDRRRRLLKNRYRLHPSSRHIALVCRHSGQWPMPPLYLRLGSSEH